MKRAFFFRMSAGVLIGLGCVLPGVSGGVIAVSFGLYAKMLDAALAFPRHPGRSMRFLLPLILGGGAGVLTGAKLLGVVMARYEAMALFLFIGFIFGGIPDLLKEADVNSAFRPKCLIPLFMGLALGLTPLALHGRAGEPLATLSPMQALLAGALEGFGTVVPGVSTSFLLIYLGWYHAYLQAVATLELRTLALFAAGFAAFAMLSMKIVQWLLRTATQMTYYAVLGFLTASIGLIFPDFGHGRALCLNVIALLLGLAGALRLSRAGRAAGTEGQLHAQRQL